MWNSSYLGTTVTNQNSNREKIKSRLNFGNACSLSFIAEYFVIHFYTKKYKDLDIQTNFACCFAWCLTMREEHRLIVFENLVLRNICGPKMGMVTRE
jgi:hypothetical protein